MPTISDAHGQRSQRVSLRNYQGGMNVVSPADQIAENQAQLIKNMEYDRNYAVLRTRDGTTKYVDVGATAVNGLFAALNGTYLLATCGGKLYKIAGDPLAATEIGSLSGSSRPQFVHWGDAGLIYIASGGAIQKFDGTTLSTAGGAYATMTTACTGTNNDLTFTAKASGTGGNSISVTYVNPGGAGALSVAVVGTDITVTLAYSGAITSTAAEVKAAVEAKAEAAALVTVSYPTGNDGSGVVTAVSKTTLAGGAAAPTADILMVRFGRLVAAMTGTSALKFSGIGDPEMWADDSTDAGGQEISEVGYKDGLSIVAVYPISQDLAIFKGDSNGRRGTAYRLAGATPSEWAVYEVSRDVLPVSKDSVAQIGGVLSALDWRGIRSLTTTDAYGSISAGGTSPVDLLLSAAASTAAFIAPLPLKALTLVVPAQDVAYVLDTQYGAWLQWDFPFGVCSATSYGTNVYFGGSDGDVYTLDDTVATDEGTAIPYEVIPRETAPGGPLCVKRYGIRYEITDDASFTLEVGPSTLAVTGEPAPSDIAYSDTDEAFSDPDPLVSSEVQRKEKRVNFVTESVAPHLRGYSGRLSLREIYFDAAMVGG